MQSKESIQKVIGSWREVVRTLMVAGASVALLVALTYSFDTLPAQAQENAGVPTGDLVAAADTDSDFIEKGVEGDIPTLDELKALFKPEQILASTATSLTTGVYAYHRDSNPFYFVEVRASYEGKGIGPAIKATLTFTVEGGSLYAALDLGECEQLEGLPVTQRCTAVVSLPSDRTSLYFSTKVGGVYGKSTYFKISSSVRTDVPGVTWKDEPAMLLLEPEPGSELQPVPVLPSISDQRILLTQIISGSTSFTGAEPITPTLSMTTATTS